MKTRICSIPGFLPLNWLGSVMAPSCAFLWLLSLGLPSLRAAEPVAVAPELVAQSYLEEIARHLYRWYIDESDLDRVVDKSDFVLWLRMVDEELDKGDKSRFAEIIVPQIRVGLKVKRTEYTIEDLGLKVSSPVFKIVYVSRVDPPEEAPAGYKVVTIARQEMMDRLFEKRSQREYPDVAMRDQLLKTLLKQFEKEGTNVPRPPHKMHVVFVSPLSPVANEIWAYWESGRMLLHFTSDLDLSNPAVLAQTAVSIRTYKMDGQVVVSQLETPGSNAYLTRDQAGRALYNCLVLGQRIEIPDYDRPVPPEAPR